MAIQPDPTAGNGTSAEESGHARYRRLARVSLLFGILSIPLAFLFIPGAIAVVCGYKARKDRLLRSRGELVPFMGFVGMCLGFMSFLLGVVMMSFAPLASMDRALGTATRSAGIALESGVENFYSEFGRMPVDDEGMTTDSERGAHLLGVLLGREGHASEVRNPRDIRFLAVREAVARKNGLVYGDGERPEAMFDSYGNPYTVFLMGEGKQNLQFRYGGKRIELQGRRAAVVSPGKDGKLGTEDDIKSW